jgi:hypothetical protein
MKKQNKEVKCVLSEANLLVDESESQDEENATNDFILVQSRKNKKGKRKCKRMSPLFKVQENLNLKKRERVMGKSLPMNMVNFYLCQNERPLLELKWIEEKRFICINQESTFVV